jgi:hypothetical protein
MRENCTSGLMRGSNGNGNSRPLLSTLPLICGFNFVFVPVRLRSEPALSLSNGAGCVHSWFQVVR